VVVEAPPTLAVELTAPVFEGQAVTQAGTDPP
jgi:hypothetical protein